MRTLTQEEFNVIKNILHRVQSGELDLHEPKNIILKDLVDSVCDKLSNEK